MEALKLNVYDNDGNVIKTSEAQPIDFKFGTIRSLMKLLNVDNINDTTELLKAVYGAWDQVISILSQCFPDITDEEWDNVKVGELIPVLVDTLKYSFANILSIPQDSDAKN